MIHNLTTFPTTGNIVIVMLVGDAIMVLGSIIIEG